MNHSEINMIELHFCYAINIHDMCFSLMRSRVLRVDESGSHGQG